MDNKPIKYAVLHGSIFVPSIGQMGPTLSMEGSGKVTGLKMTLEDKFLNVNVRGTEILVPFTSILHMVPEK